MTAAKLSDRKCVPCTGETPPLSADRVRELHAQIPDWGLGAGAKWISRSWLVADFMTGIDFFRRVAEVAEAEDHHPNLRLFDYRNVQIDLWTHATGWLTENDFIVAAKIDALEQPRLR